MVYRRLLSFAFLFLLASKSFGFGSILRCSAPKGSSFINLRTSLLQAMPFGVMDFDCGSYTLKAESTNIALLSMRYTNAYFLLMCTADDPTGKYAGVKVGASAILGLDFSVFAGKKGVCTFSGVSGGAQMGVDLDILRLEIQ